MLHMPAHNRPLMQPAVQSLHAKARPIMPAPPTCALMSSLHISALPLRAARCSAELPRVHLIQSSPS